MTKRRRFGSIRKLPSGQFQARYQDSNGRVHTAPETYGKRTDAERFLVRTEAAMERGSWHDPRLGRITFKAWCDEYFAGAVHKRDTTMKRDKAVVRAWLSPEFGTKPLGSITPLDVRRLVEKMSKTLKVRSLRTNYGVLHTIMQAAVDADLIMVTPCRGIKLPSPPPTDKRYLTAEEEMKLAGELPLEYQAVAYVAGVVGLRWSEVAGLKVGAINFLSRPATLEVRETVSEVKSGSPKAAEVKTRSSKRNVQVPAFVVDLLAAHLAETGRRDPDEYVFQSPDGGPLKYSQFRKTVWLPAVKRAGFEGVTFHGLRHSAAGLLRATGAHTQVIAGVLGHSSDRVTSQVYGWVPTAMNDAATAALDALFDPSSGTGLARPTAEGTPEG